MLLAGDIGGTKTNLAIFNFHKDLEIEAGQTVAEFAQLQGATVDSELEALKRERRLGSVQIQKELPPAPGH